MKPTILTILLLLVLPHQSMAENLLWKQETQLNPVSGPVFSPDDPNAENHGYFESYVLQSVYGPKLYYTLIDHGGRTSMSFVGSFLDSGNERLRDEVTEINTLQSTSTPFDWGGIVVDGTYKPLYAIKRIYDPYFDYSTDQPDQSKSGLIVWRLPVDGVNKHCQLAIASNNLEARAIAERDYLKPSCANWAA